MFPRAAAVTNAPSEKRSAPRPARRSSAFNWPQGCTDWSFPAQCPSGQACSGGACAVSAEVHGGHQAVRHHRAGSRDLRPQRNLGDDAKLPPVLSVGACTVGASCTPGTVRCNANNVEVCNASGSAWLYRESCNVGCNVRQVCAPTLAWEARAAATAAAWRPAPTAG